MKEQVDPLTNEILESLATINSDREPENSNAPKCVFCYTAQSYDSDSIPTFMDYVETGKLRILEKRQNLDIDAESLPYLQTDLFVEEVSNLKLKYLSSGRLGIDRVVKMNKDRFSSVQYGLWYIKAFMDYVYVEQEDDDDLLIQMAQWY